MAKIIKGISKQCARNDTAKNGYQELWDTGRASRKKMKSKITGINRPSV